MLFPAFWFRWSEGDGGDNAASDGGDDDTDDDNAGDDDGGDDNGGDDDAGDDDGGGDNDGEGARDDFDADEIGVHAGSFDSIDFDFKFSVMSPCSKLVYDI